MDFLSPVLKLIGSLLLDEYSGITGISDKLKAWEGKLPTIQAVLDSSEEKKMKGDTATATWLSDLRDVAYDMEDLLEEFSVEAKREAQKVQALSRSTKLPYCLISCCSRFSPHTLISDHHMANEIEEVGQRLEEICSSIPILGLVHNLRSAPHHNRPCFVTTSVPEPKIVGREKQIMELLARLAVSKETTDSFRPFNVVSIFGMGGLGKTTLAQELYNKAEFEVKAWACVSDVFDMATITKSILDQVAPSSSNAAKDLNQLQNSLIEKLSGKKFLIVLDDVWNDDFNELESLVKPLYSGRKGSRILLTTRNLEVAKSVGDPHPMRLDLLPLEDCVSLLAYHSLDKKNFERHPRLRDIAKQLAEKCKGLPISVKMIGRLLRFEFDDKKWKGLLTHDIWSIEGNIPSALKLSYLHLPVHLRRCFTACAVFPKDYMFDQDEVIRLWIIHGLLQKGTGQTYQNVGIENLQWLEAFSLFQKVRDEFEESFYSMHDLVNDLAKSIDDGSYFCSDEYKDGSSCHGKSAGKVRHASMVTQSGESLHSKRFDVYRAMNKLRTFLAFQISTFREPNVYVSGEVICDLIINMNKLQMLSLRGFRVRELPDRIGELKLLCCIDLSHTTIEVLPQSICDLVELQSLLIRACRELKELPENIHKLTKLLHLDITGTNSSLKMPPHIGDLTNLEILSDLVVGEEVGRDLKQLGPLKCLQRGLNIRNLLAVDDVKDARVANLPGKVGVLDLRLYWGSYSRVSWYHQFELLLQHLQPSENIESLTISAYWGKRFPSWFDNPLRLKYIVRITLSECGSVDSLPPLGQLPSLKSLDIMCLDSVSSIGTEIYGTEKPYFPKLRRLIFSTMKSWEKWLFHGENENDQPFPCLRQLRVLNCPKLKGGCSLSLPSLVEIYINDCDGEMLNYLAGLTSMTKMKIEHIPHLVHFDRRIQTSWVSLEEMTIENCPQFKSFVDGDGVEQLSPKLKKLEIIDCGDIVKLPDDLSGLTSLKEMRIINCGKLSSFQSKGPVSLRKLQLSGCQSLPQSLFELQDSLEELTLSFLPGLVSIRDIVPKASLVSRSLRELKIDSCGSLTTLTDSLQHLSALSDLSLINCRELEMDIFPTLPSNLSCFMLYKCPKVKSLPQDMHRLTSLKELSVGCCQGITSFPNLPCNLSSFNLDSCSDVNNLPQEMHRLSSLKQLSIENCEGITSLPRGGLPPYLESLVIRGCQKLHQPIEEWGLRDLTALRELRIEGRMEWMDEMKVFPPPRSDADWSGILPSSLVNLRIGEMEKLERVGGGHRDHLTSLQCLHIYICERMKWLPEDGLPGSLEHFSISECPLLTEKCWEGEGEYWHSHLRLIPRIEIDYKDI